MRLLKNLKDKHSLKEGTDGVSLFLQTANILLA